MLARLKQWVWVTVGWNFPAPYPRVHTLSSHQVFRCLAMHPRGAAVASGAVAPVARWSKVPYLVGSPFTEGNYVISRRGNSPTAY